MTCVDTTTLYCSHHCANLSYKERMRERRRQPKRMVHTRRNTGKIRHDLCRHPLASLLQQYPLKERTWTNLLLNTRERTFNDSMTEKAEAIRCRRYESIVNDRYDFLDKVYIYLFLFATLPPPFIKYNLSQYTILTASIYYIHVHNILYCI